MKKILLALAATALCFSCAKDQTRDIAPVAPDTLSVSFADDNTKVQLDDAAKTVWNADDRVSVFYYSNANDCWKFMGATGDRSGNLKRESQGDSSTILDKIVVVYPYNEEYTISPTDNTIKTSIPSVQHYVQGSYGISANIMVSTGTSNSFSMKNLYGWLKLQLSGGKTIKKITLRGNENERLSGQAVIDYETPKLIMDDGTTLDDNEVGGTLVFDDENSITLDCGEGVALSETPTAFYFALAPQTFENGITIVITYSDDTTFERSTNNSITITRNHITPMAEMVTAIPLNQIWYTSTDGNIVEPKQTADFGANIISNTYENGRGIITFDGDVLYIGEHAFSSWILKSIEIPNSVTRIESEAFGSCHNLSNINFSNSLTFIGDYAFDHCVNLKTILIPDSVTTIGSCAFANCNSMQNIITGHNVKDIGNYAFSGCTGKLFFNSDEFNNNEIRPTFPLYSSKFTSVVIGENVTKIADYLFYGCAELKQITIPNNVISIKNYSFQDCTNLEYINIPNSITSIGDLVFEGCVKLKEVRIPENLESISCYAFKGCPNIQHFYGNADFVSDDNLCLFGENPITGLCDKSYLISFANGSGVIEYTIPQYVTIIENYAFANNQDIKSITFPDNINKIGPCAFENCDNLEYIYGNYASADNKCAVVNGELQLFLDKGIKAYTTPDYVTSIGGNAFAYKKDLEEIVLSDNVIGTGGYGYIFIGSKNLKKVTISANMRYLGCDPFGGIADADSCDNLSTVYCRAVIPPSLQTNSPDSIDFPNLTIYVPQQSFELYMNSSDWGPYKKYIQGYNYTDLPDYYISSDYSADGTVRTLQKATIGNGIDIVLMADAYSDRQIAAGDYDKAVQTAYENLFTEEPYKSFRNLFNVYAVTAVSATEGYEHNATAFLGYFGSGTLVGGNDATVFKYAQKAVTADRMDDALIVVMMNSESYAGTCYMYYPTSGDYGRGTSVAYFPLGTDSQMFAQLLHHEACGHGFAKLADEYAYESMGAITSDVLADINKYAACGWYKNVDFTNDPSSIKWSRFLSDVRYTYDGLGAYEGGLTYWTGVWRPTENSIMRYNTGGFNTPSREAIYYRIHKLAYGESWTYNYEDFVAYDAINRQTSASQSVKSRPITPERFEPLAPPVVVKHSWRDAK